MAKTGTLKDNETGEVIYPTTLASEVYDANGNAIPTIYATKDSVEGVLLWQNGSPNASFTAQTITTADTSQYRFIDIYYKPYYYNEIQTIMVNRYQVSSSTEIDMHLTGTFNNDYEHYNAARSVTRKTTTTISIANCYKANGNATKGAVDNYRCIPIAIYGVK